MTSLTPREADLVRENPGMFDKATEEEAWRMRAVGSMRGHGGPIHSAGRSILVFAWVVTILSLASVLSGCDNAGIPPECRTCIGPYDITLTSHREALQ